MQNNIKIIIGILAVIVILGVILAYSKKNTTPPQPTSAAKINISAVCEEALAFMTFTDGASADAFVAECKEGKHPEVIENYISNLNLPEGVAI